MPETFVPHQRPERGRKSSSLDSVISVVLPYSRDRPEGWEHWHHHGEQKEYQFLELLLFLSATTLWVLGFGMIGFFGYLAATQSEFNTVPGLSYFKTALSFSGMSGVSLLLTALFATMCLDVHHPTLPYYAVCVFVLWSVSTVCITVQTGISVSSRVSGAEAVRRRMLQLFRQYNVDTASTNILDTTQRTLHCCGVTSPKDWETEFKMPPISCCQDLNLTLGREQSDCLKWYTKGCVDSYLEHWSNPNSYIAGVSCLYLVMLILVILPLIIAYRISLLEKQRLAQIPTIVDRPSSISQTSTSPRVHRISFQ